MSTASRVSGMLHRCLSQPTRGVVGVVDNLVALCQQHGLDLDWQPGRYLVRAPGTDWEELPDLPLPKSAFRAILARLAVLCDEQTPDFVSPYGGHAELSDRNDPPTILRITFVSTPAEQTLELTTGSAGTTSSRDGRPTQR